jgi:ribosomal protein L11 methyltransferase
VGCGSGILGIAAARLGASSVVCVDVDPDAVASALQHGRLNAVALHMVCCDGCRAINARFDVVLANIARGPLLDRRDELVAATSPGGCLILSGLLLEDVDAVRTAYAVLGLAEVATEGEWAAVVFRGRRAR